MGCGCKKNNQSQPQPAQTVKTTNQQAVQTAIQKTVEKYYEKK
jgi:hypothetical protein